MHGEQQGGDLGGRLRCPELLQGTEYEDTTNEMKKDVREVEKRRRILRCERFAYEKKIKKWPIVQLRIGSREEDVGDLNSWYTGKMLGNSGNNGSRPDDINDS